MTRRVAAVACSLLFAVAACSGSGDPPPDGSAAPVASDPNRRGSVEVDRIRPAVELLERQLGGVQQFVEVNVTQTEVNLFVLRDGLDLAYVVRNGAVEEPSAPGVPYAGPTFTASQLDFAPTVIDVVVENMTESEVVAFSATARTGGIDYIATVRTTKREFRVLLSADGGVLDTE